MLNRKFINLQKNLLAIKIAFLTVIVFTPLILAAQTPAPKPCFDFTGTGRTSFATITGRTTVSPNLTWRILSNGGDGSSQTFPYGFGRTVEVNDQITPGYYDGDNRADVVVWRTSPIGQNEPGTYYIRPSTLTAGNPNAFYGVQWGLSGDFAGREADYDGDGRDDLTVVRLEPIPAQGDPYRAAMVWFVLRSGTNTFSAIRFGEYPIGFMPSSPADIPVVGADYNGDGRAEITVIRDYLYNEGNNTYFAGDSTTGALVLAQNWGGGGPLGGGGNGDVYVIGDYIGDRRADFAVMRLFGSGVTAPNATWFIKENGGSGQIVIRQFGYGDIAPYNTADAPVCGDYNGDGKQDIAVYRPSNSTFYWLNSPGFNTFSGQQWGQPGDEPIAARRSY